VTTPDGGEGAVEKTVSTASTAPEELPAPPPLPPLTVLLERLFPAQAPASSRGTESGQASLPEAEAAEATPRSSDAPGPGTIAGIALAVAAVVAGAVAVAAVLRRRAAAGPSGSLRAAMLHAELQQEEEGRGADYAARIGDLTELYAGGALTHADYQKSLRSLTSIASQDVVARDLFGDGAA